MTEHEKRACDLMASIPHGDCEDAQSWLDARMRISKALDEAQEAGRREREEQLSGYSGHLLQVLGERDQARKALAEAKAVLEFYAQKPVPDNGTEWGESCKEWGHQSFTWDVLPDFGNRARALLDKLRELK